MHKEKWINTIKLVGINVMQYYYHFQRKKKAKKKCLIEKFYEWPESSYIEKHKSCDSS